MLDKAAILRSGAIVFGFIELFITNLQRGNGAVILDCHKHRDRTGKTFFVGGIAGSFGCCRRYNDFFFNGFVQRFNNSLGGDGSAADGINIFNSQGQRLAHKLFGEAAFLRPGAIVFGFIKLFITDLQPCYDAVIFYRYKDSYRARKTLGGRRISCPFSSRAVIGVQVGIYFGSDIIHSAGHSI